MILVKPQFERPKLNRLQTNCILHLPIAIANETTAITNKTMPTIFKVLLRFLVRKNSVDPKTVNIMPDKALEQATVKRVEVRNFFKLHMSLILELNAGRSRR